MPNLETTFAGLKLKNPIIVGSSGLTNSVDKIREIAQKGAAAVVLKSLFEEQIIHDVNSTIKHSAHSGADDYIAEYIKSNSINTYLNLIKETKAKTDIPIIASINCQNSAKWVSFAKEIENAGADALEVNVYFLPIDKNKPSSEYEQTYFDLLKSL
ncbi:MAG TPA: diguanylate cyclase, partial [Salinivirgaceae bacterium]|nr:diguanylate cyclase [Salinivirgaceae bacterium]